MSILLNKSYLVNESTKGEGGSKKPQILSTWFVHSPVNKCQNNIDYQYDYNIQNTPKFWVLKC